MKVVALVPAYNEEKNILETLSAVEKINSIQKIVVINDGSTDRTSKLITENGKTTLLNLSQNMGKGAALNLGIRSSTADIYLLLDADLGHTAIYGAELLNPVLNGEAQMTIARFNRGEQNLTDSKMGFGIAKAFACWGVRSLTGQSVTSPLSGQRAINAEVLHTLGPFFSGFSVEIGLTVGALHHGYTVLEVPLPMKHRGYGRGIKGIKHRGRQLIHITKGLYQCWQRGWR